MDIRPFAIERFYERWEFRTELMLSSSDCESLSVQDLLALEPDAGERLRRVAGSGPSWLRRAGSHRGCSSVGKSGKRAPPKKR